MFRLLIIPAVFCAFIIGVIALVPTPGAASLKPQDRTKTVPTPTPAPAKVDKNTKNFTAEQIAESAIFIYGSRPVLQQIRSIREERYGLFRGFFHGVSDQEAAENLQPRLHTVLVNERSHAIGRSLDELGIGDWVEVTGVRRRGARSVRPDADWRFEPGDALVLLGRPSELDRAEKRLTEGE